MGMTSWERAVLALVTIAVVALVALAVGASRERLRHLALVTAVATFVLIVLGAYVRLADAGLGCPDWPGCYGEFTPSLASDAIQSAQAQAPQGPVSMPKAWKEMTHRYLAMLVGCLILAIAVSATRQRRRFDSHPGLAWILVAAVVFQAALGAWTVTWLLKPAIVTLHLAGGITILALLVWYRSRVAPERVGNTRANVLRVPALLALIALAIQIVLGGWVSANYAAAACGELPLCQDAVLPPMDFDNGFHLVRELGKTAQGAGLPLPALTAIHLTHRFFALIVLAVFVWLIARAWQIAGCRRLALGLAVALLTQIALGLTVVWSMSNAHLDLALQLPAAAGHNAVAAALLVLVLLINFKASAARRLH
jgi:cytochrome c oxidase assembly protein subunit 15